MLPTPSFLASMFYSKVLKQSQIMTHDSSGYLLGLRQVEGGVHVAGLKDPICWGVKDEKTTWTPFCTADFTVG